jgi:AcrR family transcriptional regulator
MPKSSDQSTRDRILRSAVEEIAEVGWQGARTRSIAGRAGVNNALVHYHFSTMEDLLLEAAATAFAHLAEGAAASAGRLPWVSIPGVLVLGSIISTLVAS